MDNEVIDRRTLKIFFAGAGMDGETRYELHGLSTDIGDLTRSQLYEVLKESGIPTEIINRNNQQIDELSKKAAADGDRPAVVFQV
jgi:hypothetical protein